MNNERYNQLIDEAYENYCKSFENQSTIEQYSFDTDPMSQLMFIGKIKTISEFSKKWGLKIEESELNYNERFRIAYKNIDLRKKLESETKMLHYPDGHNKVMDDAKIPTKLITVTYKEEKIEVYE